MIVLAGAKCGDGAEPPRTGTEPGDMAVAESLATSPALHAWPAEAGSKPVILYVDRSGSMRGFLDPEYHTRVRTDYRSVIDGLVVGLKPDSAFGFGTRITSISPSLGTLGDRTVYSDNNTELESALDLIALDIGLGKSHVLVGDGRRSNPNAANEQYVRIRTLADTWVRSGGTFMVAASLAPFRPVPDDPSGCRRAGNGEEEENEDNPEEAGEHGTCPLYAFAFVAPGEQTRIASVLGDRFQHLFVWPVPAVPSAGTVAAAEGAASDVQFERAWSRAADGTPILRTRGPQFSNRPLRIRLALKDTTSPAGVAANAALRGQGLRSDLSVKPLDGAGRDWGSSAAQGGLLRQVPGEPLAFEALTRGADQPRYLYRIELYPNGVPGWLDEFDAENAGDALRTYGLGRLFELFRTRGGQPGVPPAARVYVVAN
ncbi:MAG TPA: hypothetical protein VF092_17155 [Longimicrobium sp.]